MKASIIGCPPQTRLAPDAAGKAGFRNENGNSEKRFDKEW